MKKLIIIIIILLIGGFLYYQSQFSQDETNLNSENLNQEAEVTEEDLEENNLNQGKDKIAADPVQPKEQIELTEEINLEIPFTPQAPYAIWDEIHNEACEEAALLMVHKFWHKEPLNPEN